MLPLSLLKTAVGHRVLVELKNGETYNGELVNCDSFMNMNLKNVECSSRCGDRFWAITACYIRGNTVKYLQIPDAVIDEVPVEQPPVAVPPTTTQRQQPAASTASSAAQSGTGRQGASWGNRGRRADGNFAASGAPQRGSSGRGGGGQQRGGRSGARGGGRGGGSAAAGHRGGGRNLRQ